eukprot:s351_g42.t1
MTRKEHFSVTWIEKLPCRIRAVAVSQALSVGTHLRWVAGSEMLSDALTKATARKFLLQLLSQQQEWRLVYDPDFVAGRKLNKKEHENRAKVQMETFLQHVQHFAVQNSLPWGEGPESVTEEDRMLQDLRSMTGVNSEDIFISTWSLQRSETLWGEDANSFNPHRWKEKINGNGLWQGYSPEKSTNYPDERATDYAFLPFGAGSRKCVGDNFALLEAEAVLVALLQRFEFKAPAGKRKVEMTTGATIHTAGGLLMEVKKRTDRRAQKHGEGRKEVDVKGVVNMEKKLRGTVAQRIEPEALVVPTAKELRMLFTAQKEDVRKLSPTPELFEALEKAYKQCQEVTKEYSKTFYLGSQLLDQDEQRVVWAIYNWCRSTDELVDGPEAANTTMADLEEWEERLNRIFQLQVPADGDPADLAMVDSIRKFSLIQRPFQDMVGGMAMDLVKERYATFYELEVYCYRVAGTVGIMTLPVLGFDPMQNFTEELQERCFRKGIPRIT